MFCADKSDWEPGNRTALKRGIASGGSVAASTGIHARLNRAGCEAMLPVRAAAVPIITGFGLWATRGNWRSPAALP